MTVAARTCVCGESVLLIDKGHAERCRGPVRLRQPVYPAWDWAGIMADQDTDDRRVAPYLTDAGDDMPADRRH